MNSKCFNAFVSFTGRERNQHLRYHFIPNSCRKSNSPVHYESVINSIKFDCHMKEDILKHICFARNNIIIMQTTVKVGPYNSLLG